MGRVLTNNTGIAYAREDTENNVTNLGFLAGETGPNGAISGTPVWFQMEPNEIGAFGAEITTVAREPISKNRQRRKGAVVDLDSTVEIEADLTLSHADDFIEGFLFAKGNFSEINSRAANATGGGTDQYTVASGVGNNSKLRSLAGPQTAGSLVYARNYATAANNGLYVIDQTLASTTIGVNATLATETAPATARLEVAGLRFTDATNDLTIAFSSDILTITITDTANTAITNWSDLGLKVGQMIFVGGVNTSTGAVQNALENAAANDTYGFARIRTLSAAVMTCDRTSASLQVASPTIPATLDILFGNYIRNVPVDNADFIQRSFQFEAQFPDLGDGTAGNTDDAYQYAKGNFCNELTIELPLTDKATMSFGFIGTDTDNPTTTRKNNAVARLAPAKTGAINTTADCARLRVIEVDEDGISTDFKSISITINNNVSPEKVLCTLGAKFMNYGTLDVDVESQLVFTNPLVIDKIRGNETVGLDMILTNDDGAIAIDLPSLTLSGGEREFPVDESVLVNIEGQAFEDPLLGTSMGVTIFPITPEASVL